MWSLRRHSRERIWFCDNGRRRTTGSLVVTVKPCPEYVCGSRKRQTETERVRWQALRPSLLERHKSPRSGYGCFSTTDWSDPPRSRPRPNTTRQWPDNRDHNKYLDACAVPCARTHRWRHRAKKGQRNVVVAAVTFYILRVPTHPPAHPFAC